MSTSTSRQTDAHPFPPLSSPSTVRRSVFDNGVQADMQALADLRYAPRADHELLDACARALRDAPNVPRGRVMATVHDGTVVLNGRTSYYYERAASECAVRFVDGVRTVENHITVETPPLAHDVHKHSISG